MTILSCEHCGGEGRIFKSKYGGNDPDVWDAGKCEVCDGSGNIVDILKNLPTNPPDRVKEFSLTRGGGSYAKLFDGSEQVLSWDNILWINRSVLVP